MQVRPCRLPGGADAADALPGDHALPAVHADVGKMRVHRAHVAAVADDDEVTEAAARPAGLDHAALSRRTDAGPVGGGEVEPGVKAVAARSEAVCDRRAHGPQEPEGDVWPAATQVANGGRPGNAVDSEARPALEPA